MHQCNYCPHQTSRIYNLKRHKRNRHGIEQAPKVPRALTTVSAAACESKAPSPNQMVVPEIRPSAGNQVHYTAADQPNNGDLPLRDFPSREKYLAQRPRCDICWKTFSRKYTLKVHKRYRHGIEQTPKVPRAPTTMSAAACESKAPSPNQMVVPDIRPTTNQVHYTPPHQPNNGDLSLRDFPSREKYLAERQRCDICWKTFSRKNNLSRHRKMHFIKTPKSLHSIESSATMHMQEDKSTELDKELLEDSRDIFKIYKLLQRMKENNGS